MVETMKERPSAWISSSFSRPMAFLISSGTGDTFVMKVKERSAYTVMTTGMT